MKRLSQKVTRKGADLSSISERDVAAEDAAAPPQTVAPPKIAAPSPPTAIVLPPKAAARPQTTTEKAALPADTDLDALTTTATETAIATKVVDKFDLEHVSAWVTMTPDIYDTPANVVVVCLLQSIFCQCLPTHHYRQLRRRLRRRRCLK
jgi:hypothetical protein